MKTIANLLDGLEKKESMLEMHISSTMNVIDLLLDIQSQIPGTIDAEKEQQKITDALNDIYFIRRDLTNLLTEAKTQIINS
ncbi:MAG: hypothetical protein WCJ03_03975 [Bacteroidales bacterium]